MVAYQLCWLICCFQNIITQRRFLLVLGAAFDTRKLSASTSVCVGLKGGGVKGVVVKMVASAKHLTENALAKHA